jgi:hypothetical protein
MLSELSRQQWSEGARALERETGDPARYRQLCELVDLVIDELRRRLGSHFTLDELAAVHDRADDWVRGLVADALPPEARVGPPDTVLVLDAACHRYASGAIDYRP